MTILLVMAATGYINGAYSNSSGRVHKLHYCSRLWKTVFCFIGVVDKIKYEYPKYKIQISLEMKSDMVNRFSGSDVVLDVRSFFLWSYTLVIMLPCCTINNMTRYMCNCTPARCGQARKTMWEEQPTLRCVLRNELLWKLSLKFQYTMMLKRTK